MYHIMHVFYVVNVELCAVLQAKATVMESEKEGIARDMKDACLKTLLLLGDNRPLRLVVSI